MSLTHVHLRHTSPGETTPPPHTRNLLKDTCVLLTQIPKTLATTTPATRATSPLGYYSREWALGIQSVTWGRFVYATQGAVVQAAFPSGGVVPPGSIEPPFPALFKNFTTDIELIRGDDRDIPIGVVLGQGTTTTVVDLTGGTLRMTAKWNLRDIDAAAQFIRTSPAGGITIDDAVGGLATIHIARANTLDLPPRRTPLEYDVQFTDSAGKVYTVLIGRIYIRPDSSITSP